MYRISTGDPSTLGRYRKIAASLGGEGSEAVRFFDKKIAESPKGPAEPVLADESQMMYLIMTRIARDASPQ